MTDKQKLNIQNMDFETAFNALQENVDQLESEDLPLEKALERFERGQALAKRCAQLLEEAELASEIPQDLYDLMVRATKLRRHLERNPKDYSNKRGLQLTESMIYRVTKYYKKKGKLPRDWNYRREIVTI